MKTYSQILQREVYCVGNEKDAQELVSQGVSRGDIFCGWEQVMLREIASTNRQLALKMGEIKQLFQGVMAENDPKDVWVSGTSEPKQKEGCWNCGSLDLWTWEGGVTRCRRCHPPVDG